MSTIRVDSALLSEYRSFFDDVVGNAEKLPNLSGAGLSLRVLTGVQGSLVDLENVKDGLSEKMLNSIGGVDSVFTEVDNVLAQGF